VISIVLIRNSLLFHDQDWQKESAVDDLISKTVTLSCCCCKSAISAAATSGWSKRRNYIALVISQSRPRMTSSSLRPRRARAGVCRGVCVCVWERDWCLSGSTTGIIISACLYVLTAAHLSARPQIPPHEPSAPCSPVLHPLAPTPPLPLNLITRSLTYPYH
jgi:hypothetical protein